MLTTPKCKSASTIEPQDSWPNARKSKRKYKSCVCKNKTKSTRKKENAQTRTHTKHRNCCKERRQKDALTKKEKLHPQTKAKAQKLHNLCTTSSATNKTKNWNKTKAHKNAQKKKSTIQKTMLCTKMRTNWNWQTTLQQTIDKWMCASLRWTSIASSILCMTMHVHL